jgi:hypothetical protein
MYLKAIYKLEELRKQCVHEKFKTNPSQAKITWIHPNFKHLNKKVSIKMSIRTCYHHLVHNCPDYNISFQERGSFKLV